MQAFTSADKFQVKGHDVYTFYGIDGFNPRSLKRGDVVTIDGHERTVLSVETYALIDATGSNFGIAVTDEQC